MLYRRHIDHVNIESNPLTFYSRKRVNRRYFLGLTSECRALNKEALSTIFKVFGMARPGIEPTTSCTPSKFSTTGPPGVVLLGNDQLKWKDDRCLTSKNMLQHKVCLQDMPSQQEGLCVLGLTGGTVIIAN